MYWMKRYRFFPGDYVESTHPEFPGIKGVIVRILEKEDELPMAVIEIEGNKDKRFVASMDDIKLIPDVD